MNIPVIIHYKADKEGNGSDLRMTLRSFERFMPDVGEVIIVGDGHGWLTGVTHIPFKHPYKSNKDSNIMMACIKGAAYLLESGYKGDVVVASDDCVLLTPYKQGLYYEESGQSFLESFPARLRGNTWHEAPYQSILRCMKLGWKADQCECHVPQFVSVGAILSLLDAPIGEVYLGAKTLIVNAERTLGRRTAESVAIHKISPFELSVESFQRGAHRFCNWSPGTDSPKLREALLNIFPTPSRYESNGV
jgi:hypothetical protein